MLKQQSIPTEMPDSDSDNIGYLAEGSATNLFGKFVGRSTHFGSQIFLARLLGPFSFGLYSIGWNILRLVSIFSTLGLEYGLIHFGAQYWQKDESKLNHIIRTSTILAIGSGLLWGIAFYLLAPQIAVAYDKSSLVPVLRLISISFPFVAGLKVLSNATRITKKMMYAIIAEEFGQPFSNLIILVVIYLVAGELIHAVSAGVASFFIGFCLSFRYVIRIFFQHEPFIKASFNYVIDLIKFSIPTAIATIFATLLLITDRLLVGYFLSESDAGIYQAVSLISVFFVTILASFKTILAPLVSEAHHRNDSSRLGLIFQLSTRWSLYLVFPVAVLLWIYPEQSILALFGPEYAHAGLTLVILVSAYFVYVAKGPVDMMLILTGNQSVWLKITGLVFTQNIILNLILIPMFGMAGGAISTLTSITTLAAISLVHIHRRNGTTPFSLSLFKGFLSAVIASVLLSLLDPDFISSPVLAILARLIISVSIFAASLLILKLDPADYDFFRHWINQIRPNRAI